KTIFWRNNIVSFAPVMGVPTEVSTGSSAAPVKTTLLGTWSHHSVTLPDNRTYTTGMDQTNSWWHVDGRWFHDDAPEAIVGESFAARNNVKPSDTLHVNSSDRSIALTVTGILSAAGPEDDAIVTPLQVAQQLASKP